MSTTLRRPVNHAAGYLVFAIAMLVYAATAGGSLTSTDAVVTFTVTQQLIDHGSFALPEDLEHGVVRPGADGRLYAPFGIGQSIYNIPFVLLARAVQTSTGLRLGDRDALPKAVVGIANLFPAAVAVWLAYLFACRLSGNAGRAAVAAFSLAFGTLLWPYAQFGFNAPLATCTLLAAVYHLWVGVRTDRHRSLLWSGIWLGVAGLTRHEMFLVSLPFGVWLLTEPGASFARSRRRAVAFGVPVVGAWLVWCGYNLARFGHPLDAGYLTENAMGFGRGLGSGLSGLLFSPGASVFLYAPVTVVGCLALGQARDRRTALLCGLVAGTLFVFYASLGNWYGGRSYGPRFLVPLLPYLCIPLAEWLGRPRSRWARWGVVVVLGGSVLLQLPGVLVDYTRIPPGLAPPEAYSRPLADRYAAWATAPLVLTTRGALEAIPRNARYLVGAQPIPDVSNRPDDSLARRLTFSLDLWWLYLFYLGVLPKSVALAFGVAPLVLAAGCGWWLCRLTAGAD